MYGRPIHPDTHVCSECSLRLQGRCPFCREENYRKETHPGYELVYLYRNNRIHELIKSLSSASLNSLVTIG